MDAIDLQTHHEADTGDITRLHMHAKRRTEQAAGRRNHRGSGLDTFWVFLNRNTFIPETAARCRDGMPGIGKALG